MSIRKKYFLKPGFHYTTGWKIGLAVLGIVIIVISLWYTNKLVNKIRLNERNNTELWANTIVQKSHLMRSADSLFKTLKLEERRRVALLAKAYEKINSNDENNDLTFFVDMLKENKSIPLVLTDENNKIRIANNIELPDSLVYLTGVWHKEFSEYPAVKIRFVNNTNWRVHYKNSIVYNQIQTIIDGLNQSFLNEIVLNTASVPVLITDSTYRHIESYGNISSDIIADSAKTAALIKEMRAENDPIEISLPQNDTRYLLYRNSDLQDQLRYFPLLILFAVSFLVLLGYLVFSAHRKSEQNQVWAGLAKETAHQLGTPLSSMMAWIDLLRMENAKEAYLAELEKDVHRLEIITDRFGKIGSVPMLKTTDIVHVVGNMLDYLKMRSSKRIHFYFSYHPVKGQQIMAPVNEQLFGWVIENVCKNAIDAMMGEGDITVELTEQTEQVLIDITDTGKGMSPRLFRSIFRPGFTTKKRGWGLGLSLAARIIRDYHQGKIFVLRSTINQGTTFRIILRKK